MEPLKKLIPLAGLSFEISHEEGNPYILTPDEEERAIEHELIALKKHKAWKMAEIGMKEGDILQKLSEIDFNALIDRQAILYKANSNKQYGIWQKEQREKEKREAAEKLEELKRTWTANKVYQLMAWGSLNTYGKKLIINDDTRHLIKTLCFFISSDARFETELGYDLKKGLLLRGISGLGKTHLVKCIMGNPLRPILILSMIEIADKIKADGEYSIPIKEQKVIYLDDVGTEEPEVNHYGTKINWFKNFIETFYLNNKPFNSLMISTNNSFDEIEKKYGFRVRSRVKDIFNIVDVYGTDLRGQ